MGGGDGHGRDHGIVRADEIDEDGDNTMEQQEKRSRAVRLDYTRLDSSQAKSSPSPSQVEATCVGSGEVWSMKLLLWQSGFGLGTQ